MQMITRESLMLASYARDRHCHGIEFEIFSRPACFKILLSLRESSCDRIYFRIVITVSLYPNL